MNLLKRPTTPLSKLVGFILTLAVSGFVLLIASQQAAMAQPNLASATFFGGAGDQYGYGIAIQGNAIYVDGYYNGPVLRYAVPVLPGATPVWSNTLSGVQFYGVTTTASTVYAVGVGIPPACGAVDGVGDTEGKSVWALYDSATGNFISCQSTNYFPYRGGESLQGAVQTSSFFFAAGTAETCGFGNNSFVLSKFDLNGVLLQAAVEVGETVGQTSCIGDSHASGLALFNGNLYVAGGSKLSGEDGVPRPVLLKYATDLTRQWKARPVDRIGNFTAAAGFSGAIYAVGSIQANGGDFLIEKYDEAGNRIWSQTSGGVGDDELFGVVGIGTRVYAVGFTTSQGSGGQDLVILEIDPATGSTLSTTLYGGALDDAAYGAATDGTDLYVVGASKSFASPAGNLVGQSDGVLLRYTVAVHLQCDINNSGHVNVDDISLIMAARGTLVAPGDPRDVDHDGIVTANDARVCALKCDKPGCAR